MMFLILILLILIFYKSKINIKGFFNDYMQKDKTLAIKGIFVVFVFYRHCAGYITLNNMIDMPMILLDKILAQSIVAMFLFYSGYGIYEQIKKKREIYIKELPKKRIIKILIQFSIAIISFLIMDILLGRVYSIKTILLSFIGWESIGNSNWYMFLTFVLYIFILISFNIFKKDDKKAILLTIILTILYSFVILKYKDQWWMDTSLCFSVGMIYSYYKDKIDKFLINNYRYFLSAFILIIFYLLLSYVYIKVYNPMIYSIISVVFSLLIVLITMKISIKNKLLILLGKNVFWMYILQRIPMIVFVEFGINKYPYIYFILCFVVTMGLSYIYTNVVDKKINKF